VEKIEDVGRRGFGAYFSSKYKTLTHLEELKNCIG